MIYVDKLVPLGAKIAGTPMEAEVGTLRIVANGFIVTSLLWSSALAALIDRKLFWGAAFFLVAALCAAFGIIHSPAPGSPLFVPWETGEITGKMQLFLGFYPKPVLDRLKPAVDDLVVHVHETTTFGGPASDGTKP